MKGFAFALMLLLAGCAPQVQTVESEVRGLEFVLKQDLGTNTAYVLVAERAVIRRVVVTGKNLSTDDASCRPWKRLEGALECAHGVVIEPAPRGYRLNLGAGSAIRGNVCVKFHNQITLSCKNLTMFPPS